MAWMFIAPHRPGQVRWVEKDRQAGTHCKQKETKTSHPIQPSIHPPTCRPDPPRTSHTSTRRHSHCTDRFHHRWVHPPTCVLLTDSHVSLFVSSSRRSLKAHPWNRQAHTDTQMQTDASKDVRAREQTPCIHATQEQQTLVWSFVRCPMDGWMDGWVSLSLSNMPMLTQCHDSTGTGSTCTVTDRQDTPPSLHSIEAKTP